MSNTDDDVNKRRLQVRKAATRLRERRREDGLRSVRVELAPETLAALDALCAARNQSRADVITRLIADASRP